MFYGQEKALPYPVTDLFDDNLILANISAAKDMYDKNQQQQKEFAAKYGDFVSPNKYDTEKWYSQFGKVNDAINYLYENHIPLNSSEAQSLIGRTINSMPYGEFAKMKERSAIMNEYVKNVGDLKAKGQYDPDFDRFVHNGKSIADWNPDTDGDWTDTSPMIYKDPQDIVDEILKGHEKTLKGRDGEGNLVYGYDTKDARTSIDAYNASGFITSPQGQYMLQKYKQKYGVSDDSTAYSHMLNDMTNMASKYDTKEIKADQSYWNRQELNEKKREFDLGQEMEQKKLELEKAKAMIDAAKGSGKGTDMSYEDYIQASGALSESAFMQANLGNNYKINPSGKKLTQAQADAAHSQAFNVAFQKSLSHRDNSGLRDYYDHINQAGIPMYTIANNTAATLNQIFGITTDADIDRRYILKLGLGQPDENGWYNLTPDKARGMVSSVSLMRNYAKYAGGNNYLAKRMAKRLDQCQTQDNGNNHSIGAIPMHRNKIRVGDNMVYAPDDKGRYHYYKEVQVADNDANYGNHWWTGDRRDRNAISYYIPVRESSLSDKTRYSNNSSIPAWTTEYMINSKKQIPDEDK